MLQGYPLYCVPVVNLCDSDELDHRYEQACVEGEDEDRYVLDTSCVGIDSTPYTGRDHLNRQAALIVQIVHYAQTRECLREKTTIVTAHERYHIAVSPEGKVYMRSRRALMVV